MSARDFVQILTGGESPRVWSLIVTIFGDLAHSDEAEISSALIGRITGEIGIKPEATRVALHRLRHEGWLAVRRAGRGSHYRLTPNSLTETRDVIPRIYGKEVPEHAWLIVRPPGSQAGPKAVSVAPNVEIAEEPPRDEKFYGHVLTDGASLPAWMRDNVCSPELVTLCRQAENRFKTLDQALGDPAALSHFQRAVLRVLIVHIWRRIVLRAPHLSGSVFPDGWLGDSCRERAHDLLSKLPAATLDELEKTIA